MAKRLPVTRIDFSVGGEVVVVNKVAERLTPDGRDIVLESTQKALAELDAMLAWCESHGWVVRRYLPLGARAWKGDQPRLVRTREQIQKKRAELVRRPVPGLEAHALDLAFDL